MGIFMELKIHCKSVSKRRNAIQTISYIYEEPIHTVKDLLAETVKINVAAFEERRENAALLKVLTKEEIDDKAEAGKIGFDRIYGDRKPDIKKAVESAIECFQDGLVVIFIEGEQVTKLEEQLTLKDGDEITFVRMTMLSGRMW